VTTRRKATHGALILAAGKAITQASGLVRNIIVAGIIGASNMGVAATFLLTITFLEAVSAVAGDKFLVQDREGNDARLQASVQSVMLIRASILAVAIFLLAQPIAWLFNTPDAINAYRLLALVPLLRGLQNLDQKRIQRDMRFLQNTIVTTLPAVVMLLAAYPVAIWLNDYNAVLALLLLGAAAQTLATHAMAERRFALAWDPEFIRRAMAFGWPLLINGVLMFVILQGDNFLIGSGERIFGSTYTKADLGVYAVAMILAMAPTGAVASISSSVMLTLLSRAQDDAGLFERRCRFCVATLCVASSAMSPLLIIAGPSIAVLLYGHEYAEIVQVLGILAAMQALRMIKVGPTLAAMSKGDTRTLMVTNIIRTAAFGGAIYAASVSAPLAWIALSGLVGEVVALAFALMRLRTLHGVPFGASLPGVLIACIGILVSGAIFLLCRDAGDAILITLGVVVSLVATAMNTFAIASTREEAIRVIRRLHRAVPVGPAA
jgi:O-antigen/teichoic acid export membrane protein